MSFSSEKFEALLLQSKGLMLLPDEQRGAFIDYAMRAEMTEQIRIFERLVSDEQKSAAAKQEYDLKVKAAWDEYINTVQRLQREGLTNMRKKKENISNKEEEFKMDKLLSSLNSL